MSQTRSRSLFESLANVAVGYGVAVWAQTIIFPWFGVHLATRDHLWMGGFFTVVSIARSYILRRLFNLWDIITARAAIKPPCPTVGVQPADVGHRAQ